MVRRASLSVAFAVVALLVLSSTHRAYPGVGPQRLTLWAWERPERLTFLPANTAVAFLAESIELNSEPELKPRFQPLYVNNQTPLIAVVRLNTTPYTPTAITKQYRDTIVRELLHVVELPRVHALQVDFDATASQRGFYRKLLTDVRAGLPPKFPLSITALGSWCLGDDWISDLPIDDAVPMLFRMGVDRANIVSQLQRGHDFSEPLCRNSIGVSTDEPWPETLLRRNIYVFNPHSWDAASFAAVQRKLTQ